MCNFCLAHGDGDKWYLNARNYSRKMIEDPDRPMFMDEFMLDLEHDVMRILPVIDMSMRLPVIHRMLRRIADGWFETWHAGQIVPLHDARAILRLAGQNGGIARVSCICRRMFKGRRHEPMCLGLGVDFPWARPFDHYVDYTKNVERLSLEEADRFVEECDRNGFIHNVGTLKTPFVVGLCACEYPICAFMQIRMKFGIQSALRKAEYLAFVDPEKCNGCRQCVTRCQFGAISVSRETGKATIHLNDCFGCGLCETGCKKTAITLVPRERIAAHQNDW